ncbi:MAG: 16S rRNA (adenine(1518)-N(6)/adenine(1519)-N(6))-dimethyltransferase RsmA [Firmicutes bacterium]|nr:16S rRNA (adenine(1518)-N(6)/adenine(1519)-N(6))-dimethyltransferase RsmA [Bacillota bacterium]
MVAALMREHGLGFRKSLGQNFLVDRNILLKVVAATEPTDSDCILEVGAGIGTLTVALAPACRRVVAIEIDRALIPLLSENVRGFGNIEIVHGDATKMDLAAIAGVFPPGDCGRPWKVVSNLPYYATSPIITGALSAVGRVSRMVFMVQKEVALRMVAAPGSDEYGAFSIACQYRTIPRIYSVVPRRAFMPPPEVDSAIVVMDARETRDYDVPDEAMFFRVVRETFSHRRKTILSALKGAFGKDEVSQALHRAGITPGRRGETLSIGEFAALSRALGTMFAKAGS